jgi:aspartyl-tRNA(Asn)/glutamyl-tRNA(Gln) amidotransferase subunit A
LIERLSAAAMAAKLKAREISAVELAEAHFARIEKDNPELNAFLHVSREEALAQAEKAQEKLDKNEVGPLTGVPIALKDNMVTKGVPTTCASKILEDWRPPYDAHIVERLNAEGVVSLGKTNLDEFAMGTSNENSAFGPVRNPWDRERTPGGSSGGSAAAVAGCLAPMGLGSDTGGSIRLPGSFSGIVGFKPTYGRVSRYGLIAFASSLDQIGPLTRTVEDAALISHVISGHDDRDSTSLPDSQIRLEGLKSGSLKGLRIGLPRQMESGDIDPGVRAAMDQTWEALKREGAELIPVDLPSLSLGVTTYYIIAPAEASSNLARFDGIRFGPRIEEGGHNDSTAATRGRLFGHEVKLRIMVGTYALSAGYYDAYYHRAQQVRGLMSAEFERACQDVDVIASPTSSVPPFKLGTVDHMALKMLDIFTIPANMGGFPSISIPCGLSENLPVGLLLTGPVMGDERLLQQAFSMEQALGFDASPPID